MTFIEIDARRGGGILRTALALAVSTDVAIRVFNIRREAREPGLGWPHLQLLDAVGRWTGAAVEGATWGSTEIRLRPGKTTPNGSCRLDLDDPARTFEVTDVVVQRHYDAVVDRFPGGVLNVGARGARGHSVVTPLMALLPLLATGAGDIDARGGTETPGAPFIDALDRALVPVLRREFGVDLRVEVVERGCFGIGGGAVRVGTGRPVEASAVDGCERTAYVFGEPDVTWESVRSASALADERIAEVLGAPVTVREIRIPYAVRRVHQLYTLGGPWPRDVSICAEEVDVRADAGAIASRVIGEARTPGLASRFVVEQLLLWAAVLGAGGCWRTERMTEHLAGVIDVVQQLSGRGVTSHDVSGGVEVTLA